jgi:hypothetical protein
MHFYATKSLINTLHFILKLLEEEITILLYSLYKTVSHVGGIILTGIQDISEYHCNGPSVLTVSLSLNKYVMQRMPF